MSTSVLIIGAGWSGLEIAWVLRQLGHQVEVVEVLDDVGGTWHPARAYAGLSIHTPAFRCDFHDARGWPSVNRLDRVPAPSVHDNCRTFAATHDLRPCITCNQRVTAIAWDSRARRHTVTVQDTVSGATSVRHADYVVNTQFNAPRLPDFAGREAFRGRVLHSTAVTTAVIEQLQRDRPAVVLLGASKGAADIALLLLRHGVPFTWLARRWYWFLSFDRGYRDQRTGLPSSAWYRWVYFLGLGIARGPLTTRLALAAWRAVGLLQTPGTPSRSLSAFHHGWLDDGQVETLRTQTSRVTGSVDRLDASAVHLRDGRAVPCDVLLCATGADPIAEPIALSADGRAVPYDAVERVYRYSVIPDLPRLVFTGYAMFGFGPLNGYHRAAWIQRFIEQDLSPDALAAQARADASPAYPFRRGSFLFDGDVNVLVAVKTMNRLMSEGLYAYADLKAHYRDIAVRHVYAPLRGVSRFLAARGVPPAPSASSPPTPR